MGENTSLFLSGEFSSFRGGMSAWNNFTTYFNGTVPAATDLDWSPVDDMSDINVTRMGIAAGLRFRSETGYGLELSAAVNDYDDEDPYLEDESGSHSRFMALFSKAF